ncbi:glycoside hydrolase family 15 protein [Mycetocola manganoxydans]|uniref:Glycoside hydrolase family 15 protein n=1 Tax=Mycetocola manganoxydans TaxID=699879 RepID=A0A3L6ZS65_9MICO|nr:glycoside hydrolase family 15 protein [Mycetocola manganoxydans]RLP70688.1 glycoside hydrolase family 15 protein [Mycetocola manganoxydans]GHD48864.1 glycoside hydrolase family 15 [Mycetocola manganoxydans]
MAVPIEDYALISDCYTAALVAKSGSIDWLCMPRYDSPSMFGALLGTEDNGRWLLAPAEDGATATRRYDGDSFTLVTTWTTPTGVVDVVDVMPRSDHRADVIRRVRCLHGTVTMRQQLRVRFGYSTAMPWVRKLHEGNGTALLAVAGPDAVIIRGPELFAADHEHAGTFDVIDGETVDITMTWFPSHREPPPPSRVDDQVALTADWWRNWASILEQHGAYADEVARSLLIMRALTHEETGGIVAAATTSLPEDFGGSRNWDYRYVWLRDASLTVTALVSCGITEGVDRWRLWLLRAIAGDPKDVQIMYGLGGERDLLERELPHLPGYDGAAPVRIGNGAALQFQSDVIGEVMVALHDARVAGVPETPYSWALQRALVSFMETHWQAPDQGIWEIRGEPQRFTHSRVMMWAAFDRAIAAVTEFGLEGPVDRWIELRALIREEIESEGYDPARNSYTQYYGTTEVDASLLQLVDVGYCRADDPRMLGTVAAIESDLLRDGLLLRYRTQTGVDGLPGDEHPFLACSFWLVCQYARTGRLVEARALMDRLVGFANDVGLLSEEYDVTIGRQAGNTPQAFSHLALVLAAKAIRAGESGAYG